MKAFSLSGWKNSSLTSRDSFGLLLTLFVFLFSVGGWQAFFSSAVDLKEGGINGIILWFFFLSVVFLLGVVVWRRLSVRILGAVCAFVPALFFLHQWYVVVFVLFSIAISVLGMWLAEREMAERLSFHFFKTAAAGQFFFVLGLSLVLSSGYFSLLKQASWEEIVPRFRLGEGGAVVFFQVASYFQPDLRGLVQRQATVDEFLLDLEKQQFSGGDESKKATTDLAAFEFDFSVVPGVEKYLKENGLVLEGMAEVSSAEELYLRSGREQFSALVGRPVSGDEKITDIFSLAIQRKMITYLSGGETTRHSSSEAVPFILSVLLFLTLLPLGGLVGIVCRVLGYFVFRLALKRQWLVMVRIPGERQALGE